MAAATATLWLLPLALIFWVQAEFGFREDIYQDIDDLKDELFQDVYWTKDDRQASGQDCDCKANKLFADYWAWRMEESPELATRIGSRLYADQLDSYSLAAFQRRFNKSQQFMTRANNLQCDLSPNVKLSLRMLKEDVRAVIEGHKFKGYLFPMNFLEGIHKSLPRLISQMKKDTLQDYENILQRYRTFNIQAREVQTLMEEGIRIGYTNSIYSMNPILDQIKKLTYVLVEDSVFYQPFKNFPPSICLQDRTRLQSFARIIILLRVNTALIKLYRFIKDKYLTAARPNIAVTSLPDGADFYQQCLRFHTSTSLTAKEIHQLGQREVFSLEKKIKGLISSLGYNMTLREFTEELQKQPERLFSSADSMFNYYTTTVFHTIKPALCREFDPIPKTPLRVEQVSQRGPSAFYQAGSFDGSKPGVFAVNTINYASNLKLKAIATSLHEAYPGHHMSLAHLFEIPNFPDFRKGQDHRKYHQAPSRFPLHTAYTEGWAMYGEWLGIKLGLYNDPYNLFGMYSTGIFRAVRIMVDTGIHALGWTRQQAIDFMVEHTASPRAFIEAEVDRYITWPGQAVAYRVGQIKMQEFREKAERELGANFDVFKFHNVILDAAGPLNVVEELVEQYIKDTKSNVGKLVEPHQHPWLL